ncbi:SET domain-containing protein [Arenibaculum pallidiluteum]|uniref:SET domain-containing protein n=1 Tax=Arenibaculum pallidiluteum TaxID=2812559 RepID=UPI001F1B78BA|nr:SET domain-containing protein [Arenibaculum pallidiluteum]
MIDTRLGPSTIEGQGLFATEFLPAGTPVWTFDDRIDRIIVPDDAMRRSFPTFARILESHCCELGNGSILVFGDHACFVNHADAPNIGRAVADDWRVFRALRPIAAGEELTCNYEEICSAVRAIGAGRYLGLVEA